MHEFRAELWPWESNPSVYFVSLPEGVSDEVGDAVAVTLSVRD